MIVISNLKSISQRVKSASMARRVIGMVRRAFRKLDIPDFRLIHKTRDASIDDKALQLVDMVL